MVNKKISNILGPILGVMGFMIAIGVLETPALADEAVQANSTYTQSTTTAAAVYKDYSIKLNQSVYQNGLTVTLENVVATKHKLKAVVKVQNTQAFDQSKNDNSIFQLLYGGNNINEQSMSNDFIDEKTLLITIEQGSDESEFPEKGDIRLDVVFPNNKVNIGMDAQADFSELFKIGFEKNITAKIADSDYTLNKLDTDILGTTVAYSETEKSHNDRDINSSLILKAGDKMYKLRSSGSSGGDGVIKGTFESKAATYDKLKDEKSISIIPLISDITWDELSEIHKTSSKTDKDDNQKMNNISYPKSFDFSDGSKGEIYNVERNDNTVKIYCKGNSEKASLLMASNMFMYYKVTDGNISSCNYESDNYMSFYKDQKDSTGYIVEFDNVEKDKELDLFFHGNIKPIDKYILGNEIQISK